MTRQERWDAVLVVCLLVAMALDGIVALLAMHHSQWDKAIVYTLFFALAGWNVNRICDRHTS